MNLPPDQTLPRYGIWLDETRFWVVHRQGCYGPFDYQYSFDLNGIELLYQGEKYGECCSSEEFFADLKPYRLPLRVTEVAITVAGTVVRCIFQSVSQAQRATRIREQLRRSGLERYELSLKEYH